MYTVCTYIHTYVRIYTCIRTCCMYIRTYVWMDGSNVFSAYSGTYVWMDEWTDKHRSRQLFSPSTAWNTSTLKIHIWPLLMHQCRTHTHTSGRNMATGDLPTVYVLIRNRGLGLILQTATGHLLSTVLMKLRRATVYIHTATTELHSGIHESAQISSIAWIMSPGCQIRTYMMGTNIR